jgi:hypothetical protein
MKQALLYAALYLALMSAAHAQTVAPSEHVHSSAPGVIAAANGLGEVQFQVSCSAASRAPFDRAMALLHSFEYDAARTAFQEIATRDRRCAMAQWGIAMSYVHPLWAPPTDEDYRAGQAAAKRARRLGSRAPRDADFIAAASAYYAPELQSDPPERMRAYTRAMAKLYAERPKDVEVVALYGLALIATADPNDRTFKNQLEAGHLMEPFVEQARKHPGLTHYIIHGYDNFELAPRALEAARRYSIIAPDSAHALHMPSHIFERLGLWQESVESNLRSTQAARDYAEKAHLQGHWDEELHGLDFLLTGYLQIGNYDRAREIRDYVNSIDKVYPENFKVAYVFAAAPARFALERKDWNEAANLKLEHPEFPWANFPWERSVHTFAVGYAKARLADVPGAQACVETLVNEAHKLTAKNLAYKAQRLEIHAAIIDAWIELARGDPDGAIAAMQAGADREAGMIIPDGAIIPAAEILGDMHLGLKQYERAIQAYESSKQKRRRGAITGSLSAAIALKDSARIAHYQAMLDNLSGGAQQWQASVH